MSVLSVRNNQTVQIGKNIGRTASVQISDPNASAYIADGEIVVLNSSGAVATTSTAYPASPFIQTVQRSGSNLIFSDRIYGDKVTLYRGKASSAGAEQIYHIGYNGSSGSLDVTLGVDYFTTLSFNHDDMMWSEQKQKYVTVTSAVTGATQAGLAKDIATQWAKAYVNNSVPVTAVMLNSGSGVASDSGNARTVVVAHGSPVITYSGSTDRVTAGAVIRLGATGSGRGTTVPTYTVKEAHPTISNAWILDQPYMGPSATIADGNHGAITTVGTNWGVRFTGKSLPFVKDFFKFKRVAFTVGLSGFGATVVTKTQESSYGYGDGRLVAEEESFCKGFLGALNRMTVPLPTVTFDAVSTTSASINTTYGDAFTVADQLYETVEVGYFTANDQVITAGAKMPALLKIFLISGAGQNAGASSDIVDVLDAYLNTCPTAWAACGIS
jgi:hypothetical protein